ncbi:MAG: DUF3619 family protein [Rugosibacter sp.]|jgi:hypothetical protein|nr:DUF3619 family protein [Rugosibacter sp.]MDO9273208.1 DUF3619 family protein [Rugosibacter sp.]
MNKEAEFASKICNQLEAGMSALDPAVLIRLHKARRLALSAQTVHDLKFVGIVAAAEQKILSHAKTLLMVLALSVGTIGTYYWNGDEQAHERDEIDSALLTDELPPTAYLDLGFQAWLKPSVDLSSQ